MESERRLTIEFGDGDVDEYRIRKSSVEFRARYRGSMHGLKRAGEWRCLSPEDIALHVALHTHVAHWLTVRLLKRARLSRPPTRWLLDRSLLLILLAALVSAPAAATLTPLLPGSWRAAHDTQHCFGPATATRNSRCASQPTVYSSSQPVPLPQPAHPQLGRAVSSGVASHPFITEFVPHHATGKARPVQKTCAHYSCNLSR